MCCVSQSDISDIKIPNNLAHAKTICNYRYQNHLVQQQHLCEIDTRKCIHYEDTTVANTKINS